MDVQRNIEAAVEKRTRETYGPPPGKKLLIFIDDMNMPLVDTYGTQQPIAFLKFLFEKGGFYDRGKDLSLMYMKDMCKFDPRSRLIDGFGLRILEIIIFRDDRLFGSNGKTGWRKERSGSKIHLHVLHLQCRISRGRDPRLHLHEYSDRASADIFRGSARYRDNFSANYFATL